MNKIFKVKYNAQTGQYTVVSELAKSAVKTGKVLTALVGSLISVSVFAGEPDIGNRRPSIAPGRVTDLEIDAKLTEFRKDPTLSKYHMNAGDNNSGQISPAWSELYPQISTACQTRRVLFHRDCTSDDRTKIVEYFQDYAIEAIQLRDSELPTNNISPYTGRDYTPDGDNNKAVYTIQGGNWDRFTFNLEPDSEFPIVIPDSASLGIADVGRGRNSGVYRDIMADNATLNVEGNAVFLGRPTYHSSMIYVLDGGAVNFNGEHTYLVSISGVSPGHTLRIGHNGENPGDHLYANVTANNLTIMHGTGHRLTKGRGPSVVVGNNEVGSPESKLTVNKNFYSDSRGWTHGSGVYVLKSGVVDVTGTSIIRMDRGDGNTGIGTNNTALVIENGLYHGQGDISVLSGNNINWNGGYQQQRAVHNDGGRLFADSNLNIRLLSKNGKGLHLTTRENIRSVTDVAGNLNMRHGEARAYDNPNNWGVEVTKGGVGIEVDGGDLRIAGDLTSRAENTGDVYSVKLLDGTVSVAGNLDLEVISANRGGATATPPANSETKNNTIIELNGANANLNVTGNSTLKVNSLNSTGINATKGKIVLGDKSTPNSAEFRAGTVATQHEDAQVDFIKGTITQASSTTNAVILSPEAGKKAVYKQAEGTSIVGAATANNSNGLVIKDNTGDITFAATIQGKIEEKGRTEKNADTTDQYATINLAGEGTLTVSNTAEVLTQEDNAAILKKDDRNITADVAGKIIGRVMLTGKGVNSLTLSDKADSKASNMKVIDGGEGGGASTLTLKGDGYLLNAYTASNAATQALPAGQTVSQLLNWDTAEVGAENTASTLNLVGDTTVTEKVMIGSKGWLTKRQIQDVTLTTKNVTNNGTIDLRDNTFAGNNKLTITGDYVGGVGSRVLMNTYWYRDRTAENGGVMDENGGASYSDLLHIKGAASGKTTVIPTLKAIDNTTDKKIIGDVELRDGDITEQVGTPTTTVTTETVGNKEITTRMVTTTFAKRINTVAVVKVDGQDDGSSFNGRAYVDDGTEVQLTNRSTANGGREYYWTMYATREHNTPYITERELPPQDPPQDPPVDNPPQDPPQDPPVDNPPQDPPQDPPVDNPPQDPPQDPPVDNPPQDPPQDPPVDNSPQDSVVIVTSKVPVYTQTPRANLELGYTALGSLHERRGENQTTAWDSCGCVQEKATGQAWVRVFGKYLELDGKYRFDMNQKHFGIQGGWDFDIDYNRETGSRYHSGVFLTYARGNTDHFDRYRAVNGFISDDKYMGQTQTDAYSLGLSHTRYAKHGGYVDLVGQVSYLQNNYKPRDADRVKQNGVGLAASVEVGRPYAFKGTQWMIEPQAQLTYQFLHLNGFKDKHFEVKQSDVQGLRGRLGVRLAHNSQHGHFTDTIYFSADVLQDITGGGKTRVGTGEYSEKYNRTWWQVGVGGQLPVSKHGYIYASAHYEQDFGNLKRHGYRASIGYKHTW